MRRDLNVNFYTIFSEFYDCYIRGQWLKAQIVCGFLEEIKTNDGPTITLAKFMGSYNWQCPKDWPGYRKLTEK